MHAVPPTVSAVVHSTVCPTVPTKEPATNTIRGSSQSTSRSTFLPVRSRWSAAELSATVNLLAKYEFRPPGEREQRDRDDRRRPQRPLHPAAGDRGGTQGARHARPLLLTAQHDEAEAERQHGARDEVRPERLERRSEPGAAQAQRDGDQGPSAAE